MKRFFAILCLFLAALLFTAPGLVLAEDAGTPLGGALADFMSGTLFPLINALVLGLVGWAAVTIGKKYKIDALIASEGLIQDAAYKGVTLAEEWAAKRLKTANIRVSSSEKLNLAIAQVLKAAPLISRDEAREYVESVLARVTGAGATADKVVM